jgi:hypothetical protein
MHSLELHIPNPDSPHMAQPEAETNNIHEKKKKKKTKTKPKY